MSDTNVYKLNHLVNGAHALVNAVLAFSFAALFTAFFGLILGFGIEKTAAWTVVLSLMAFGAAFVASFIALKNRFK